MSNGPSGHLTAHTLTGCEWGFPPIRLPLGSNTLSLFFRDVNNNAITTNFDVLILPGPPLTIEYPAPESLICGESGVCIGRVDDLQATVTVNGTNAPVSEDGHFYCVGLPLQTTNEWIVRSGTNETSVRFYRSPITLTYSISTSSSPHMPLPFLVNGYVSDTNVTLRIGERLITPDATGAWKYRGDPPKKGILPITIIPKAKSGGTTSSAIIAPSEAQYYITAHSIFHRYETKTDSSWNEYWKQFSGALSKGDVTYSLLKYQHEELCTDDYSGYWPYLWLDNSVGPCSVSSWRIYPAQTEIAQYTDDFENDSLIHTAQSVCQFYTGGTPGGNRLLNIAIEFSAVKLWRDGTWGDEINGANTADLATVGYLGGVPLNSDGTIYITASEGSYVDVTPTLNAMNNLWAQFSFDWTIVYP